MWRGHIHFPSTKKVARWWAKAQAGWLLSSASACFCSLSHPMLSRFEHLSTVLISSSGDREPVPGRPSTYDLKRFIC
jgi:hypothetical protein